VGKLITHLLSCYIAICQEDENESKYYMDIESEDDPVKEISQGRFDVLRRSLHPELSTIFKIRVKCLKQLSFTIIYTSQGDNRNSKIPLV
jgi:hypothetical protein